MQFMPATKSIKVSERAYKGLKMAAVKSGEHIYEVIDQLVKEMKQRDTLTALRHAAHRNHDYIPTSCTGCEIIQDVIGRLATNGTKERSR